MNMTTHLHIAAGLALAGLAISPAISGEPEIIDCRVFPNGLADCEHGPGTNDYFIFSGDTVTVDPAIWKFADFLESEWALRDERLKAAKLAHDRAKEMHMAGESRFPEAGRFFCESMLWVSRYAVQEAAGKQPDWQAIRYALDFLELYSKLPRIYGADSETIKTGYEEIGLSLMEIAEIALNTEDEPHQAIIGQSNIQAIETGYWYLEVACGHGSKKADDMLRLMHS